MTRNLLTSSTHNLVFSYMPMTLFFAVLAILCVFSVITFLCGTGKLKKLHTETEGSKEHRLISKLNSNLSSRALSMVKMLSWRKLQPEEDEGDYSHHEEEALWRKNILMGERCRPMNFSGKIENDSERKTLPHADEYH